MERNSILSLRGAISISKSKLKLNLFVSVVTNMVVFTFLDLLDGLFCVIYSYIDHLLEGSNNSSTCYCHRKKKKKNKKETTSGNGSGSGGGEVPVAVDRESELSETLFQRKNVFRELIKRILILMMGRYHFESREENEEKKKKKLVRAEGTTSSSLLNLAIIRWSDCRCSSCSSWTKAEANLRLHYVLLQPSGSGADQLGLDSKVTPNSKNDVLFLHGFLSSSSLWTETVFPNLSESARRSSRLFAVDLLGFGRSPKPRNCLYTIRDHLEMIENSVISPFIIGSEKEKSNFHLVAHSMGCVLAASLAAKYPTTVTSLTLVAPPYFPQLPKDISSSSSFTVLEKLAPKKLWPPLLFGAAFMSWYEHLGRIICFLICRSHRAWESILKLLTRKRDLPFVITDLPRHTHHSAWHTMHNVICHGMTLMDDYLDTLVKQGVKVVVVQGDKDQVVPLECSYSLKRRLPQADLRIVQGEDHSSVVIARPKDFATDLESVWASTSRAVSGLS